ncbi:hypothetical protein [Shewanella sp. YIC-542]|uniref:hypothetical protein n=1 Tax=Shewanella mytili TaxID=3377111 RepID=UPI00398EA7B0
MDCQSTRTRTARKPHQCCESQTTINLGEQYAFTSGVWNGKPASFKNARTIGNILAQTSRYVNLTPSEGDDYPYFG